MWWTRFRGGGGGGLENGQNVNFVVNETEDIPPEERTIIDQIR